MIPYPMSDLKSGKPIGGFKVAEVYPEGRGGMSRVVRAVPRDGSKREVALKVSRTGSNQEYFFAAIQKEVEVLQDLEHPGVVRLVPVSKGKNPYKERAIEILGAPWFFGMECLRGGSLDAYVRGVGPLTLEEAAKICYQVGKALLHVHGKGFSHNDIKPNNVLFRRSLQVGDQFDPVLVDFGVAVKTVKRQPDGSVVYMAPERILDSYEPVAPELLVGQDLTKSDVWSLGILFYRMLVGREPFMGISDRSITSAILRAMPESMLNKRRDIPREVDEFILEGCLTKDPKFRVTLNQFMDFIKPYSDDCVVKRVPKPKRRFLWWR
jgi:serine/threonine protein kinase